MSEIIGWHDCHLINDLWLSSVVVNTLKALMHRVFAVKVRAFSPSFVVYSKYR